MNQIERRICALERADSPRAAALPTVLPDDTPDADLDRLRAAGVEAYRFSDAVGLFI